MALGLNVKKRRLQLGLTQTELAHVVGISQVAIANLEKRDSKSSRNLIALAEALQCSVQELELGDMVREKPSAYILNSVPELEIQQAGEWQYYKGKSKRALPRVALNGGENTFFILVDGDSMTAPIGVYPSFPCGYSVHVDPDKKVEHNDFVLAKLHGGQIVFKQIKFEDGDYYLKSLNPNFEPIFDEFNTVGVVIAASLQLV